MAQPSSGAQNHKLQILIWVPSSAISGMTFYTGDRFPHWKYNLFVGGLQFGGIRGAGQLYRIVFNEKWEEIRREALLVELRQRIRDVRQGFDGLLYLLTDEDDGAILKLELRRRVRARPRPRHSRSDLVRSLTGISYGPTMCEGLQYHGCGSVP